MEKELTTQKPNYNFNKYGYIAFVMAGIAFLFLKEWSNVIIFIGLALVFDPFIDTKLPFPKRPLYGKINFCNWTCCGDNEIFIKY